MRGRVVHFRTASRRTCNARPYGKSNTVRTTGGRPFRGLAFPLGWGRDGDARPDARRHRSNEAWYAVDNASRCHANYLCNGAQRSGKRSVYAVRRMRGRVVHFRTASRRTCNARPYGKSNTVRTTGGRPFRGLAFPLGWGRDGDARPDARRHRSNEAWYAVDNASRCRANYLCNGAQRSGKRSVYAVRRMRSQVCGEAAIRICLQFLFNS